MAGKADGSMDRYWMEEVVGSMAECRIEEMVVAMVGSMVGWMTGKVACWLDG